MVAVASRRYGDARRRAAAGAASSPPSASASTSSAGNPRQALNVIAVGFAYQLVLVFAAVMAAQALGIAAAGPTALLAFFPAVAIAQVLPISICGLGVREGLFVLFLHPLGVPERAGGRPRPAALRAEPAGEPARRARVRHRRAPPAGGRRDGSADATGREPADRVRPAGLRWWREVLYILVFYVVYSAVRNTFGSIGGVGRATVDIAFDHAKAIIAIQDAIGLWFEPELQRVVPRPAAARRHPGLEHLLRHRPLRRHRRRRWSVLFRRQPDRYPAWRNTLAAMTALALIGFASFSLMPPRLLDDTSIYGACREQEPRPATATAIVDTLADYGGLWSFDSGAMAKVSNQYAAMPSMHTGWSTWCALVLCRWSAGGGPRCSSSLYPVATVFCILITGNHYWLDAVGGLVALWAPATPSAAPAANAPRTPPAATRRRARAAWSPADPSARRSTAHSQRDRRAVVAADRQQALAAAGPDGAGGSRRRSRPGSIRSQASGALAGWPAGRRRRSRSAAPSRPARAGTAGRWSA